MQKCLFVALCFLVSVPFTSSSSSSKSSSFCPCEIVDRPDIWQKELMARWMVHTLDWGVLSTISTRLSTRSPFGNVYSFVDGSCRNATGIPYFYGTYFDQSFQDMKQNPQASFTLSEASFNSVCIAKSSSTSTNKTSGAPLKACAIHAPTSHHHHSSHSGDPENPVCARLTLTGTLTPVHNTTLEFATIQAAMFVRHATMRDWPQDHGWTIVKLQIEDVWLIDYFGGASIIKVKDYFAAQLIPDEMDRVHV